MNFKAIKKKIQACQRETPLTVFELFVLPEFCLGIISSHFISVSFFLCVGGK